MNQQTGEVEKQIHNLVAIAYKAGYEDGKDEAYQSPVPTQDAYNNGARDAWECVKSIIIECYGLRESIFDGNSCVISIMEKYSPLEAIERVNKYKEKQEFIEKVLHPGDEVYFLDENYTRVVTSVFLDSGGDLEAVQISKNGKYCVDKVSLLKKTGRHFDAIEEVLEQMKGVKDYDG